MLAGSTCIGCVILYSGQHRRGERRSREQNAVPTAGEGASLEARPEAVKQKNEALKSEVCFGHSTSRYTGILLPAVTSVTVYTASTTSTGTFCVPAPSPIKSFLMNNYPVAEGAYYCSVAISRIYADGFTARIAAQDGSFQDATMGRVVHCVVTPIFFLVAIICIATLSTSRRTNAKRVFACVLQ